MPAPEIKKLIFSAMILVTFVTVQVIVSRFCYPNTYVGELPFAGMTRENSEKLLNRTIRNPIVILVKGRPYGFTYHELNFDINIEQTLNRIFYPNTRFFPNNLRYYLLSFFSVRRIPPPLIVTPETDAKIKSLIYDYSEKDAEVKLEQNAKYLTVLEHGEKYVISLPSLVAGLHRNFGSNKPIEPELVKLTPLQADVVKDTNRRLTAVYEQPLTIYFSGTNKKYSLTLPGTVLKETASLVLTPKLPERVVFDIDRDKLAAAVANRRKSADLDGIAVPIAKTQGEVMGAMIKRLKGENVTAISVPLISPDIAASRYLPKYAEVSIDDQKMHIWSRGELIRSYRISTGLYYQTPTGTFQILNKAPNAFSDIYQVFMPWWMAFGYSGELDAFFGFHELPYWLTDDGLKIQRPREKIGQPATGGCIALDIGDAKEFYDYAEIGMPVEIY
jgi:lipoprotein-anchoring transpeptidase ErfK/SrfK